ncbi:unnamed protein product [Polarella glacialis]|uniref:Uncharacterized protein n=1 Tax=Polarella glacialis TaxID=89957 RepID=A0A813G8R1_POLGL|nr:unnamed protein product [Polarella glacialis]CAE8726183.1 unnamed protein product [Polarella glacialis]
MSLFAACSSGPRSASQVSSGQHAIPGQPKSTQILPKGKNHSKVLPGAWCFIWVSDACYKAEIQDQRRELMTLVRQGGGVCTCVKKADAFGEWCGTNDGRPVVLLTNWREVKPCIQVITDRKLSWPVRIYVLTDSASAHVRASQFFHSRCTFVHVLSELGPLHIFVESCISSIHSLLATTAGSSKADESLMAEFQEWDDIDDILEYGSFAKTIPQHAFELPSATSSGNKSMA